MNINNFAYTWNKPRPAIGRDDVLSQSGFDYLTPTGTRKNVTFAELAEEEEPFDRCKYLRRRLAALPQYIRRHYAQKLETLDSRGRKHSAGWLLNTFERHVLPRIDGVNNQYLPGVLPPPLLPLHAYLQRFLWAGKKELKRLAHTLADILTSEFIRESDLQLEQTSDPEIAALSGYGRIGWLVTHLNMTPPGWSAYCSETLEAEEALCAVSRLESPSWWLNRLRRLHARWREHLMIAAGYVQKKASPYASAPCVQEWLAQKKANRDFLKAMELEDEDTGERLSLIDKVSGSVANPANRRRELMTRMRGFEDLAKDLGLVGDFYTLTAPSKYHAQLHNGKRNNKYCGASPRETQHYLCRIWAKTRAAWLRAGIRVFGFRVAEPHHDATPHWHLLLFMHPFDRDLARDIFCTYARSADSEELKGAAEMNRARFHVEPIDPLKGSATGYIAKYISKNIDGYGMDGEIDDETGVEVKERARRVCAWASRWSIRQFQQIGGAPVTVYRELRRLGERELVMHPEIEEARAAADGSWWAGYINAQGGPLVARDALRVRLRYEVTAGGSSYGDDVSRISGVYCPFADEDAFVITRTTKYKIVPKVSADQGVDLPAVDFKAVDFQGGTAAPRSSVNNCTRDPAGVNDGPGHADPDEGGPVDFDNLTRQQKREIAQRLSDNARKKRKRVVLEPVAIEGRAKIIKELLEVKGLDARPAVVTSLMAGGSLACEDVVYRVIDGRLIATGRARAVSKDALSLATHKGVDGLISRLKSAFSAA
ncbi:TPA: replication endonuclease [Klebsiella pneumoniae]|uniref:replication endonuclease n=1 Tax=Klebsiella pneumoniae TaxID=573 RepID=UPI000E2E5A0B|nr:replication endonuclease [Klebsiella pneumoniae]HBR1366643.1 replication endonuclease [Klebsiella pneumoniae]HBR2015030.1 replication endonuclease [Klebsiella pneumoniae]